jgi:outer membrane protein assembly factor BamD (BamD/ComL family)
MLYKILPWVLVAGLFVNGCTQNKSEEDETSLFEKAAGEELANKYGDAVATYEAILKKFPDSPRYDKALFMMGFLKSENLDKKKEARQHFQELIDKFPQSELTDDARFMIESIDRNQDALTTFEEKTGQ